MVYFVECHLPVEEHEVTGGAVRFPEFLKSSNDVDGLEGGAVFSEAILCFLDA